MRHTRGWKEIDDNNKIGDQRKTKKPVVISYAFVTIIIIING